MPEVNNEELRKLAEACVYGDWFKPGDLRHFDDKTGDAHGLNAEDDRLIAAADPRRILSLLDENAAKAARIAELERDKARLDFILAKYRKVVCERLSTGNLAFYVEEGFMADRCYSWIILSGDASPNAEKRAAAQRRAIDIAMQEAQADA